jgi:hypothetical protein
MAEATATVPNQEKPQKLSVKPAKTLPTDRIAFPKQLELLRAYAAASGGSGKPVTNEEIAKITNLTASTVSLGNNFFSSAGLLRKLDPGYVPTAAVLDFARSYEWDKQTASHKLAPVIGDTWFARAILPILRIRSMEEKDAIQAIADAAGAGTAHEGNIRMLVQYLEASGVVGRQGKQLGLGSAQILGAPPAPSESEGDGGGGGPTNGTPNREPARQRTTNVVAASTEGGSIAYDVSIRVRMSDMGGWSADRISSFFTGLAQVVAAGKDQDDGSS